MSQIDALQRARDALLAEAQTLLAGDTIEGEHLERYEQIEGELEDLREREKKIWRMAEVAENPANLERAVAPHMPSSASYSAPYFTPGISDPWEQQITLTRHSVSEVSSRARSAIDRTRSDLLTSDAQHRATRLIEDDSTGETAELILATSDPHYLTAWRKASVDPTLGPARWTERERVAVSRTEHVRAAMSLTDANGGYLVPFTLDPTIVLTNAGTSNPFRRICEIKTITTDTWNGVTSAGVTAEWLAEASEAADASPTFAQPSIAVHKAAAYIQASFEVRQDSGIDQEIGKLLADAKDRLEATAFATGSGSGQPEGIVTALRLTTASRVAASSNSNILAADIYEMDTQLPERWRDNASWLANRGIFNEVRQLATGSGPTHAFWVDFGGGIPPSLIGYSTYKASAMQSTLSAATASDDDVLILGDFKQYYIVDRIGMSVIFEPLVKGSNRRPTGEVGWFCTWRVGGETVLADAFRMLRV